jgi:hypothetical protein
MTSGPPGPAGSAPERDRRRDPRPSSLEDLIAALSQLPALGDVDRARAIPGLIEAAKTVLARARAAAMAAATVPGGITRAELARQLGISRSKVTEAIAAGAFDRTPPSGRDKRRLPGGPAGRDGG